jgi:predicted AlkP superfamily pyrophosphatase or phosphodiesterase
LWLTLRLAAIALLSLPTHAAGKAEHVVVVVFDGMRPDFITPQFAPNLYSLATNGVFFKRHHPVYISTTIVNGTAIATGTYPGHSGILANSDYREELNSQSPVASEVLDTLRRGDLAAKGEYIAVDTLPELIQDAGFHTYVAGTKSVTLIHDRSPRKTDTAAHSNSVTLGRGLTLPRATGESFNKANDDKPFPDAFTTPNVASDGWTTKALTKGLWKKGVPKYSLLWLSDPDVTQHAKSVGAPEALAGIDSSDKHLGEVIKALKEYGVYDRTDIFVVSDHGFSSIVRSAEIAESLRKAKLNVFTKLENPERGDVLLVNLGGSTMIYVVDRDEAVIRRTVEVLQQCDFTGTLFSRLGIEGTFPLSTIHYPMSGHGPDIVVSMHWYPERNDFGAPGLLVTPGGSKGTGTHGSLSPFDMHNTLVGAGPDLKRGFVDATPTGNIDLAPTILHLLGIPSKTPMDGRVLREALVGETGPAPEVKERRQEASRSIGLMQWNQYLQTSEVDGAMYYDEGNGTAVQK